MTLVDDLIKNVSLHMSHLHEKRGLYGECVKELYQKHNLREEDDLIQLYATVCKMITGIVDDLSEMNEDSTIEEWRELPDLRFNFSKNMFMDYFGQVSEDIKEGKSWYLPNMSVAEDSDDEGYHNNGAEVQKIDGTMDEGYYIFCDYHMLLLNEIVNMREMIYEGINYISLGNKQNIINYCSAEKKTIKNGEDGGVILKRIGVFIENMKKKQRSDKNRKKKQAKKAKKANAKKVYCNGGCGGCYGCGR